MHIPPDLPDYLAERVSVVGEQFIRPDGEFVLYWMRTAVRAHENPALDVALTMGAVLNRPVFVYHALSERYPHASDRHHTFILEGARDVAAECAQRDIGYAFHLERPGHRTAALRSLAQRAALVVTETFPIPPLSEWTAQLAAHAPCAMWTVDTACVVPMPMVASLPTRAYAFRDATATIRRARLSRSWTDVQPASAAYLPSLPFDPVDLATADIPALVARCRIDHGVAPVPHTRGGSVAGYARWNAFVASGGLTHYAARRNDALFDGVSRMSAYLHYGMVSPLRLARETAALSGDGPTKYLDELLVWREVAYAFCYHHEAPTTIDAIPRWARETLAAHESDFRELKSWETLARARSGDALWDTAQQSLLIHGELHNNVRMTWGKAIPLWTRDADAALSMLRALNHRYALDGRDPASYGGLLWCLGQFDRPFSPETPVLGSVRSRPTDQHARRLDVSAFAQQVQRPRASHTPRVAVIGAGISGLACARTLRDHGMSVTVFDKGRGVGGRTSTRREGLWTFDHGTPSFASRDARVMPYVNSWHDDQLLEPVAGSSASTWRASPTMSRLARHLAADLHVQMATMIVGMARAASHWQIEGRVPSGASNELPRSVSAEFDVVLIATPAPQAVALLETIAASRAESATETPSMAESLVSSLRQVRMSPRWCAMTSLITVAGGSQQMVLHAIQAWSEHHLEQGREDVEALIREELLSQHHTGWTAAAIDGISQIEFLRAHRWRFAHVARGLAEDCLWDRELQLGACGDWGDLGRDALEGDEAFGVERAWLSGVALAGRVLGGS